jgi:hypothetical protein
MGRRSCNEPVPSAAIKTAGGCANIRIFFRETGMPEHNWHSDAITLASPYYGRIYQHRSSEPAIRKYGLAALMVAEIIVRSRVGF